MLNIDIIKSTELEVTDDVLEARRRFYVLLYRYGYIAAVILIIIGWLLIHINWSGYVVIIIGILSLGAVFEGNKIARLVVTQQEIAGIKFIFDDAKKLQQIFVIYFREKKYNEFIEKEVRFSQAIGFRTYTYDIQQHPSTLYQRFRPGYFKGFVIEITYDTTIRGIDIFVAPDENSAAEFLKLLSMILPRKKVMIYSSVQQADFSSSIAATDFETMKSEDLDVLQEVLDATIVPRDIREFLS